VSRKLELAMRIALDLAQAQQELPKFDQALAAVEQSGKAGAKGLDAIEKSGKDAADALDRAGKQADDTADALERTGKSGATGAKGLDATGAAAGSVATALDRTEKEAAQASAALGNVGSEATASAAKIQQAGSASQKVAGETTTAIDREAAALQRQNDIRNRLIALLNTQRGIRIQEAEGQRQATAATGQFSAAMKGSALTAGEYKNALRTLPAQMTDIVTGIVSGQPFYMVAIQQGGQLKDQWGGLVPAARALVGAISPTVVAVSAGAGAFAAIAFAAKEGYEQLRAYDAALISTGSIAGITSGQLYTLASNVGAATHEYGDAAAAAEALAASGQLTGKSLEAATSAAVNLAKLTGDTIDSTTSKVIELAKAPSETLIKLNEQYHFLTASVYEQVRALEEQGKTSDAARLAIQTMADVHEQRVAQMEERAGYLEKAWVSVNNALKATWHTLQDLGRTDSEAVLRDQTAALRGATGELQQALQNGNSVAIAYYRDQVLKQKAELTKALAAYNKDVTDASQAAANQQVQDKGVSAAAAISKGLEAGASKAQKLKKATEELTKQFIALRAADPTNSLLKGVAFGPDGTVSGGAYEKRLKQLQEQYKESTKKVPKTEAQKDDAAAQRELERLKQQITLVGTLDDTRKKATETSRIQAAIDDGNFQNASDATKQQLLQQAQLLDAANLRVESDKQLLAVRQQIAALQGGKEDGDILKARRELEKLRDDLTAQGRSGDATDVSKLLNLKQASTDLTNLRQQYNQVMADIQLESQRIQVEQQAGLLTEADAQQKIVDLYKSKLGTLHELVPQMRAAATALGDPAALSSVAQIEVKLQEMEATTNRLQETVRTTFQSAFQNSLMSLVTASNSLSEAVQNFFVSIAQGMAQMVAQDWAQKIGNWASTAASSLVGTGTDTAAAATQTTAAAATQTAAVSLTAAGTTVATGATAVGASATTLTGAASALLPGAAAISTAAVQLQSAAATMLAANAAGSVAGFASGGWTGPGGKYTAVGTVHANEFVIRSESTRQSGAIPFLADFNRRGMAALESWRGYAEGGLVSAVPVSVAAPRYQLSDAGSQPNVNRMRVYVLQNEDQLVERLLKHPKTEKAIVVTAGANGAAIRAEW
jgi:phage-related minor tail protein